MSTAANQSTSTKPEIVWGAKAIAPHLGKSVSGTFATLETGKIPGAKKIAGRWGLDLRVFHRAFEAA